MSEYLKRKLLSQLKEAKEVLSGSCDGVMENALEEGISHLKSGIRDMDIQVADETPVERPAPYINYEGADLADIAIDIYKSQQPEKEEVVVEDVTPTPTGKKHHYKAIARSLTGMRNGGDSGKASPTTPSGNGNQTNNTDNYYALTTSMTLEEYEEYIKESWGLNDVEYVTEEVEEVELVEEASVTEELKQKLLQLEDTSWQSIDKVMRSLAKEFDISPKELHKKFKTENNGMIPDDWLKEQEVVEECGWFPLREAMIHKIGNPYEVSLIWKGHTRRLKFFYPELTAPSRSDMQHAVSLFYPGGRLLAYYPCEELSGNPMVLIPPMTENYTFTSEEDWVTMSDNDIDIYTLICETEGEPIEAPIVVSEGVYEITVKDYDTGEHKIINFGESYKSKDQYKAPNVPTKKKSPDKIASFSLERPNPMKESYGGQRDGIRDRKYDGYENELTDDDRKEAKNAKSKLDMEREAKAKKVADARARLNRDIAARKVNEEQLDELSGNFLRDASSKANEERRKAHRDGDSERADDKQAQSKRLFRAAQDKKRKEQTVSEDMSGMSQKSGDKRSTESGAGMTAAGVKKYNSRTGGNLKTAVTTPPSKLKAGSKAAGRRKSFCARSRSWNGERGKAARARWNC